MYTHHYYGFTFTIMIIITAITRGRHVFRRANEINTSIAVGIWSPEIISLPPRVIIILILFIGIRTRLAIVLSKHPGDKGSGETIRARFCYIIIHARAYTGRDERVKSRSRMTRLCTAYGSCVFIPILSITRTCPRRRDKTMLQVYLGI